MKGPDVSINGSLLRIQREARGWTLGDMAMRSCLSLKQVRQLEEGGSESFYSESVKLTAAKKVASLLGLPATQALIQPASSLGSSADVVSNAQPVLVDELQAEANALGQQAPEVKVLEPIDQPQLASSMTDVTPVSTPDPKSARSSLWLMLALFAAALILAAWMNPKADVVTTEAEPPPLQALPIDVSEPASSAEVMASEAVDAASR
jgi:transcriptional regulator with XRE-family HTH domain